MVARRVRRLYDLTEELRFLVKHDRAKAEMKAIVDLPNPDLDLFFRICLQNDGRISNTKRRSRFAYLEDDEVQALEEVVRRIMLDDELRPRT